MAIIEYHSGDDYVFGRESDDFRALTMITMLASLGPIYAQEPLFLFFDRMRMAVETKQYGLYWEKLADKDVELVAPVGFITWGFLSRPAGVILEKRFRPLYKDELKSGNALWVTDLAGPLGHGDLTLQAFEKMHPNYATYQATRLRGGEWVRIERRNRFTKKD